MKKYNDGDGHGDNGGNEEGNDDDNETSISGPYGPIFDPIIMPRSHLGIVKEDWLKMTTALRPRRTMYIRIGLYTDPINSIVNVYHKLLYEKIGVLDLCC